MLLLDRQTDATAQPRGEASRPGAPAGRVQLRLRADGQVLELPAGKTTIGSSPRCNVRIEQPGVQPLHCLITEGPEGLRVRSWVTNTAINGVPFEESALAVGDCLSLGPVEIDIIDPLAPVSQPAAVVAPVAETKDAELIRAGRDQARARSRQLLDTLRSERSTHQELCQQVAKLQESHLDAITEQNEISGKLESSLAELEVARRQLGDYQSVETARQQLAKRNEQLGFEIGELSAQINELKQRQAEAAEDRQKRVDEHAALEEQHRQLVDANNQLQTEFGQLANEKAAADKQSLESGEQKSQLQIEFSRLANEKNALSEQNRQLSEANSQLQSHIVQLANEKAATDEQNRQLVQQKTQLQHEAGHLAEQKAELEGEREGLRRQNDHLLSEARELAGERGSLADERTSLCHERSELRQQNESLRTRVAELNEENSAMAVGKLALVEQRDKLSREAEQLQTRLAELSEENTVLATAKESLAEERARLVAEQERLAELEREITAAVSGRENASAELYHALLQLAEMEERDGQNKAVVEAYESLSKEHDQLHNETDQLKEQIQRLTEERTAVEGAWQALSAEAATLSESRQRMADENATLIVRLEEARQQVERAQQEQSPLASAAVELERERAAKLQAEAAISAAIADGERRLEEQELRFAEQAQQLAEQSSEFNDRLRQQAEQARELADAINKLERQLADTTEMRDSLARAREEAHLQLADVELQRSEQSRRIEELESQLAAAEERAAKAAELAASQSAARLESAVAQSVSSEPEPGESAPEVISGPPTEFQWSAAHTESAPHNELNSGGKEDTASRAPIDEPTSGDMAWDRPASVARERDSVAAELPVSQPVASEWDRAVVSELRTGDAWLNPSESSGAVEEPSVWGERRSHEAPADSGSFGDDEVSSPPQPVPDWNRATDPQEVAVDGSVFAEAESLVERDDEPESKPAAKHEPPSFIDQYSHLFAEDSASSDEQTSLLKEPTPSKPLAGVVRSEQAGLFPKKDELPPVNPDDEESIEQYMAKLLQRVRGETQGGKAAREQPSRIPPNAPAAEPADRPIEGVHKGNLPHQRSAPLDMELLDTHEEGDASTTDARAAQISEPMKRRVSAPVPKTDMGALRALANESARMAIGRHELVKLRRRAVTKAIISTLAGVTSLWLMLNSSDWRSIQFITGCGTLLVAAYWAGETYRMLLNSMRVVTYSEPEGIAVEVPALPIDVEEQL